MCCVNLYRPASAVRPRVFHCGKETAFAATPQTRNKRNMTHSVRAVLKEWMKMEMLLNVQNTLKMPGLKANILLYNQCMTDSVCIFT